MLQPGEDSPHFRGKMDFFFGISCTFRPRRPVDMRLGSRSLAGSEFVQGDSRLWFRKFGAHGKFRLLN